MSFKQGFNGSTVGTLPYSYTATCVATVHCNTLADNFSCALVVHGSAKTVTSFPVFPEPRFFPLLRKKVAGEKTGNEAIKQYAHALPYMATVRSA